MPHEPILTTVVGSYPFPGWLELFGLHSEETGAEDRDEAVRDAVTVAIADQVEAGLDVITDGEQSRYDFNLSFYAYLEGLELERKPRRRLGPPAHDQRGRHRLVGELTEGSYCREHEPWRPRGRHNRRLRARVFAAYGHRCAECGRSDVPLEVHHVNTDPTDNRLANLRPLCGDCHRLATFPGI